MFDSIGLASASADSPSFLATIEAHRRLEGISHEPCFAVICTETQPSDPSWDELCERESIILLWPEVALSRLKNAATPKAEGKYRGRAPTARAKASEIRRLHGEGIGPTEIAKRLAISRASVYRVLNLSV
jgi:hypothetical protein